MTKPLIFVLHLAIFHSTNVIASDYCEAIRAKGADSAFCKSGKYARQRTAPQRTAPAKTPAERLSLCDSFGFERGTDAHAQCAMQLYISEQNPNGWTLADGPSAGARDNDLSRQEAIQEAILKEQERVRRMEQSMKLIELGTGIATGSLGGRSTPKMQSHTYTINGQIINCATTGSSTNCF